ncbi:MAG: penicillin-binding protein activator [Candidatus Krumholzibacteriota bacterium]|nr:penicillin-binding protein activator [Candidatus Krumholzibacteriota bacterium]
MRMRSLLFLVLVYLSCASVPPAVQTEKSDDEIREGLLTKIRTSVFEEDHKEIRKKGLLYIEKYGGSSEIPEVRICVGKASLNLGYLTEARTVLLPLAGGDASPSDRREALRLLARVDMENGRYQDAAEELLDAIGAGMNDSEYQETRILLARISSLLSESQLDKLRVDYASIPGIDIILEQSLSYALAGSDTSRVSSLRRQLIAADSLRVMPDRLITSRTVPAFDRKIEKTQNGDSRTIGLLCPMSGRFGRLGEAFLSGASTAMTEARMMGTIDIEIVVGDTKGSALEARELTERMIREEGVTSFVGGVLSSSTIAAAQAAQFNKVVLYSPVASEEGIDGIGDHIFQARTSSDAELIALARIACSIMGKRRIAFLSADGHRSREYEALFRESVELLGASLVVCDYYDQGNTDFKVNIERLRGADPDALFIASDVEDLILILPQLSFYEFGVQLLGTSAWNSNNLLRMAGRDMEGAVFPAVIDLKDDEEAYRSAAAFTDRQAVDVNRFVIGGYIGVRKMLEAVAQSRRNGSSIREEMSKSLENNQHQYIELVSGKGILFYTIRNEKVIDYMTLTLHR